MVTPIYIGVAGAHSTGKTQFCEALECSLRSRGISAAKIKSIGEAAKNAGIPLLDKHNYESTKWVIDHTIQNENAASERVIIVDRPVTDALSYLLAALEYRNEDIDEKKLDALKKLISNRLPNYSHLISTVLNPSISLGEGRDNDLRFRKLVDSKTHHLPNILKYNDIKLTSENSHNIIQSLVKNITNDING